VAHTQDAVTQRAAPRFTPMSRTRWPPLIRTMITGPRFTPIVNALPSIVPFVAPEEIERSRGRPFAVRLGANELTHGPSASAVAAMKDAAVDVWMYGDPKSHALRNALAIHHGVEPLNVVVGEGIDGLLNNVAHLLIGEGDGFVTSLGTYPTANYFVAGRGGVVHAVPYGPDDKQDLTALLAKAREVDAKVLYLVNPDNPSGTWHSGQHIEMLIEMLPPACVLVLDEAYYELSEEPLPAVACDDLRVLRLRTFSKAYGLAGCRIGYALGAAPLISAFDKTRNHFGVGRLSQAGALAALEDQAHLLAVRSLVRSARARLGTIAAENGLAALPSATNFVTIDCGRDAAFAKVVLSELLELDVFVRMPGVAPLDRCIRVSCGTDHEVDVFEKALPVALEKANRRVLLVT